MMDENADRQCPEFSAQCVANFQVMFSRLDRIEQQMGQEAKRSEARDTEHTQKLEIIHGRLERGSEQIAVVRRDAVEVKAWLERHELEHKSISGRIVWMLLAALVAVAGAFATLWTTGRWP